MPAQDILAKVRTYVENTALPILRRQRAVIAHSNVRPNYTHSGTYAQIADDLGRSYKGVTPSAVGGDLRTFRRTHEYLIAEGEEKETLALKARREKRRDRTFAGIRACLADDKHTYRDLGLPPPTLDEEEEKEKEKDEPRVQSAVLDRALNALLRLANGVPDSSDWEAVIVALPEIADAVDEHSALQEEVERLTEETRRHRDRVQALESKKRELEGEVDSLSQRVQRLEEENEILDELASEAGRKLENLRERLREQAEHFQRLLAEAENGNDDEGSVELPKYSEAYEAEYVYMEEFRELFEKLKEREKGKIAKTLERLNPFDPPAGIKQRKLKDFELLRLSLPDGTMVATAGGLRIYWIKEENELRVLRIRRRSESGVGYSER